MTYPTPSAAYAAGACPVCLGDGRTMQLGAAGEGVDLVVDAWRLARCSACGGSGRLDDVVAPVVAVVDVLDDYPRG